MINMFPQDKLFLENYQNDRKLKRQSLIQEIEKKTKRRLIVYTANFQHAAGAIQRQDILVMEDLLRIVSDSGAKEIDLMIQSPGGELSATEKILEMIRNRFKSFRLIVPNEAKSAATMLGLGSDEIVMGHTSELGQIDPQILKPLPNGSFTFIPAYALINTLETIKDKINKKEPYQMYLPILSNIEPEMIDICSKVIAESKEIAEEWLKKYMLKNDGKKAKKIVEDLSSTKVFKTHGKLISAKEAKELGLNIKILDKEDELWKLIWELYYRSELAFGEMPGIVKLFETAESSVNMNVQIAQIVKQG